MTRQTKDIIVAYTKAIAREAIVAEQESGTESHARRWAEARRAVRESRARLVDAINKLEAKA